MKRPMRLLLAGIEAALFLLAVWFEPTYIVRGTLRGEAFYDGKPTSWWRRELQDWDVWPSDFPCPGSIWTPQPKFMHNLRESRMERLKQFRWPLGDDCGIGIAGFVEGPTLLQGKENAAPVLRELLVDASPRIRRLARIGLNIEPIPE
jgi:hypothetical protein